MCCFRIFPSIPSKKMKAHNMLSLMLDPKFKSFHSVFYSLDMNKMLLVFRNMIKCLYSLCSWNAISCCILWQSHNLYQTKWLMRIVVWIVLKWLLEQVNWLRIFDIIKAMWKIVNALWNGGRNMEQCFL